MKKYTVLDITMRICFVIMFFFMLTIGTRFVTRQIFIEKMGWNNVFTKLVFWGDEELTQKNNDEDTMVESGEVVHKIEWSKEYPFEDDNENIDTEEISFEVTKKSEKITVVKKYEAIVNSVKDKISTYTGDMLFGHTWLTRAGKKYNGLIGYAVMPMNADSNIIILDNGYLTYPEPAVEVDEIEKLADNMSDFSEWLERQGIFFVYANAGSKVNPSNPQLPAGAMEYTNENADNLIYALNERGVNVLDYRPLQQSKYPNWYDSYYITDHHWKNTTSLWAAGVLADYLNDNAQFSFDLKIFEEDMYYIENRENYFLGGQGRILTTALTDLEPFSKIVPRFETNFTIKIPTRGVEINGPYQTTLFLEEFFDDIANYSLDDFETEMDAYHAVAWRNDALGTVKNHMKNNNEDKRILLIQDSFGYFLGTYLALDVGEIDFLNLNSFNGSLKAYVEETKPDAVVFLLCERNIRAIDETAYNSHTHFFDFR